MHCSTIVEGEHNENPKIHTVFLIMEVVDHILSTWKLENRRV
jgi:hypothetical protein